MSVGELASTCCNMGKGRIKILNKYNAEDTAVFSGLSKLEQNSFLFNSEVVNWEFIPIKRLGAITWDFVLEITI